MQLEHQMELLAVGAEPTARPTSINLLIDRVKDHGDTTLAEKARAALNVYQAVRRGPPAENKVTLKALAKRAQAPAMFNIAALAKRAAEKEAEENEGEDGGGDTYGSAPPSAAGSASFGKLKGKLKLKQEASGSSVAGGEKSNPKSAMKKSSRSSGSRTEVRLSGSSDGDDNERPSTAPRKGGLKGIIGKKGGLSAATKAASGPAPEASNKVEAVSINIDSDEEDDMLSPAGAGPSAISRDLMMSRWGR